MVLEIADRSQTADQTNAASHRELSKEDQNLLAHGSSAYRLDAHGSALIDHAHPGFWATRRQWSGCHKVLLQGQQPDVDSRSFLIV